MSKNEIYQRFLKRVDIEDWQFRAVIEFVKTSERKRSRRFRKSAARRQEGKNKQRQRRAEYIKYLNSPEWKALRIKALDFYNNECGVCGSKHNLHIHHKNYRNLFNEELSDLMILCKDCHEKEHGKIFTYSHA